MSEQKKTEKTRRIKDFARGNGVQLVGIAPVERFAKAPKGFNPKDIMPDARSVIVIGKCFPRGVLNARSKGAVTKAYEMVFDALDRCAYEMSVFIETLDGRAVPVPADAPYSFWDAERQHGQGDLSHRHAAVLAGLGSLGKNALLLTPEFGNCVNLTSILTSLSLEADPLFEEDLCISDCDRCIESCPGKAINSDGTVDQKACRAFHSIVTPRGFKLFACWECRRVCPVKGTMVRKK